MRKVTCIFMPLWEFDLLIKELFDERVEVEFGEESCTFYDKVVDDYIPENIAFLKIARRLGVDHISSMHRNICYKGYEESEVWIVYHNNEGNKPKEDEYA